MTQSHNKASTSRTSLPAPFRSSDNTGRLSAGQYGLSFHRYLVVDNVRCVPRVTYWIVYLIIIKLFVRISKEA